MKKEKDISELKARGGRARAKALTPKRMSDIAKKGAIARWGKDLPVATHQGEIESLGLSCYVLDDETRVLSRITFLQAVGWKGKAKGGVKYDEEFQKPVFLTAEALKPFITNDLLENSAPLYFMFNGQKMIGYNAELLPQVCEMYLRYRDETEGSGRKVLRQYEKIIVASEALIRAIAQVGIKALVDEATGYQYTRARNALEQVFELFIQKELRKWVKTFPDEFYYHIHRLKGWTYDEEHSNRRGVSWARLTNYLIYDRLAPGIREELKRLTPKDAKGRNKSKLFQRLTSDIGDPRLRELLASEITVMRLFDDGEWDAFEKALNRAIPIYGKVMPLLDQIEKIEKDVAALTH